MTTNQNSPYAFADKVDSENPAPPRCAEPDVDPRWFHPDNPGDYYNAMQTCDSCPRKFACREEGVTNEESGIWGGALLRGGRQIKPAFRTIQVRRGAEASRPAASKASEDLPVAVAV